jgi:dihydropteroate synthase
MNPFSVDAFLERLHHPDLPPLVMGILNLTPDSFSDGGRWLDAQGRIQVDAVVEEAHRLAREGAEVLDLGGESTRPGAEEPSLQEELSRVMPVLDALRQDAPAFLSVDTQRAEVARQAAHRGAVLINDVGAGTRDPELWPLVASLGLPYVLMHMQGTPRTMQLQPRYEDVLAEVQAFLLGSAEKLQALGLERRRILLDPGIGFGKALEHNQALLRGMTPTPGHALLVGASRKRFIAAVEETEQASLSRPEERVGGSIAAALWAVRQGARVLRVHDVAATVQALRVWRWLEA